MTKKNQVLTIHEALAVVRGLVEDRNQYTVYSLFTIFSALDSYFQNDERGDLEGFITLALSEIYTKTVNCDTETNKLQSSIFDKWRKAEFEGCYTDGNQFLDSAPSQKETTKAELSGNEKLAKDLSDLLKRTDLPPEIFNGIVDAISDISNADLSFDPDSPEYIKMVLDGIKPVLDISDQPENLNILANDISNILRNPELPKEVHERLVNSLNDSGANNSESPEWVLEGLKAWQEMK